MPKIIVGLRERLLTEARKQTEQNGYGGVTVRAVAAACGVRLSCSTPSWLPL